jgi:hypothetical protein
LLRDGERHDEPANRDGAARRGKVDKLNRN